MSNRTRIAVISLLVGSLTAAGWFVWAKLFWMPSVSIQDVRQSETLILGTELENVYTHGIRILGSGEIDGEATISLIMNGKRYQSANLSGRVRFEWGGDWYSNTAEIRYEPINVRSGNVEMHYSFFQAR